MRLQRETCNPSHPSQIHLPDNPYMARFTKFHQQRCERKAEEERCGRVKAAKGRCKRVQKAKAGKARQQRQAGRQGKGKGRAGKGRQAGAGA